MNSETPASSMPPFTGDAASGRRFFRHDGEVPDRDLVDETKNQIRALVQEIADLARSECTLADFYQGFLTKTTSALASVGGILWARTQSDQPFVSQYQINLSQTILARDEQAQQQHSRLLARLSESPQPTLVPPHSGGTNDEGGQNPTEFLLMFCPMQVDQELLGWVEILQRPGGGPATQRGYLRFMTLLCEIGSDFLKTQRLRDFSEQQRLWQSIDEFAYQANASLDPQAVAYTIANDARRLIECDRTSVALRHGTHFSIKAVSGLDSIERRSQQVKALNRLVASVVRTGHSLWYTGDDASLPPQIETDLHEYLDSAHTRSLAVIPLQPAESTDSSAALRRSSEKTKPTIEGALVLEQLSRADFSVAQRRRADYVAKHAAVAVHNALEHHSIFLLPVWKQLYHWLRPISRENLPRTMALVGVLVAIVCGLIWVPWSFQLAAKGQLMAVSQQELFAHVDGTLVEIFEPSDPRRPIEPEQVLARMTNNDLMLEVEKLEGQLSQAQEQFSKYTRARHQNLDRMERLTIESELVKAEQMVKNLTLELELVKKQTEYLTIRAPRRGHLVNWQLKRNLLGRPVNRGQHLITLVDPDTTWQLELELPERRVGHLIQAMDEHPETALTVRFTLASHPYQELVGTLRKVDRSLEVAGDQGNASRLLVEFDNQQIADELLRSGTRVTARIDCGSRSIGYVMFHELWETVYGTWLLWF